MEKRHAICSCEQLKVTVKGDPTRVSMCNCFACQRRTGSVLSVQARFTKEQVKIEGSSNTWNRVSDVGHLLTFHFCPKCGATVYYTAEEDPDGVAIAVGNFNDPSFPPASAAVYRARRHAWTGDIPPGAQLYQFRRPLKPPQ